MTSWTSEQLDRIAAADELTIATPRLDGTLRRPVPIWVVRHGEALYVRSYRGQKAVWYQSARAHGQGRISAGGVDADVTFVEVTDDDINAEVDASYRNKYARYGPRFLDPMVAPTARETTLKLAPRVNQPMKHQMNAASAATAANRPTRRWELSCQTY